MAGAGLLEFISDLLLSVIPSPELWGMLLLMVFVAYMFWRKFPASASSAIGIVLVISLTAMVGGVFEMLRSIMWAISGGVFLLGLWNYVGKR